METIINDYIHIKGARTHNLKNIEVKIPRNQLVVVTGLSGSGKSSLAYDTLFAEGQRRYVESLSAYARQFLGRISKPDIDFITGIPPAIAIEQKVNTRNPRSTVGTSTEVYDYLRLLYARVGKTYDPRSGEEIKRDNVDDVVRFLVDQPSDSEWYILAPIGWEEESIRTESLLQLHAQGFSRLFDGEVIQRLTHVMAHPEQFMNKEMMLCVDRAVQKDSDLQSRLADSVQTAFLAGDGRCRVLNGLTGVYKDFSLGFSHNGMLFEEPVEQLFSFNSPFGACPCCGGTGTVIGIDEQLVVPNPALSVYEEAVACWRGERMSHYKDLFLMEAAEILFPIHRPYKELTETQRSFLWQGGEGQGGINGFFAMLEQQRHKIQNRFLISRYTGKTRCPDCKGARLRKEALYVQVNGYTIDKLLNMPITALAPLIDHIQLDKYEEALSGRILVELTKRLHLLLEVGLGYLTLNRPSSTLSGGESRRINLVTSLGSTLTGSLYVLDEPSIGLHARDTQRLIHVLKQLRDIGNTVLVVEHDEEIIRAADQMIEIGPSAGTDGGELVYQGSPLATKFPKDAHTLNYLHGFEQIETPTPDQRRKGNGYIEVVGAAAHNLKSIDVRFPLQTLTAVTGVSGSGKSSLVKNVLYPLLSRRFMGDGSQEGTLGTLRGDLHRIRSVEMVDQNPIGRSSRSNPVTYIKAWDEIRKLYSDQPYAKQNGYGHSHFSFNIDGGRCPECQGEGVITVEMQFMADVTLTCEACGGKRFQSDILEVRYQGIDISQLLEMTVEEAIHFFGSQKGNQPKKIVERLSPLQAVGLSYVKLGQSSSTLSGGESQRVKLASFLSKEGSAHPLLFIFDEPTIGLHFHDIKKLLNSFNALIARGHTVLVVEHNMDVVKSVDWVIDLGPDAGDNGGELVFSGTPEALALREDLATGRALAIQKNYKKS
ncbi:MAG: excinuclease ABC subunit UvrA [Prevotellaceae bacterium]|jgi:excinuclease ABC subunit A|nr:excinuclease ABC subunit UvrA [Prevotellaceae bacterium]